MLGGFLLVIGHSILALEAMWAFYSGLAFIVLGVGCLKGNISTMVGGLYKKGENDRRDLGFYIFYMGINIGAATAALLVLVPGQPGWPQRFAIPAPANTSRVHVPPGDGQLGHAVLRSGKL